jgi:hypothetical protein
LDSPEDDVVDVDDKSGREDGREVADVTEAGENIASHSSKLKSGVDDMV